MNNKLKTLALVACAFAVGGSLMPWLSVHSIFGTVDIDGLSGDGKFTLAFAVIASSLIYLEVKNGLVWAAFVCGLGVFVSIYNIFSLNGKINDSEYAASIGYGLYVCLVAFAVGLLATIKLYRAHLLMLEKAELAMETVRTYF